ncbi:MAG TPA: sensor histidine kinase [Acidimicrobiales bacterium]|nr:sensor histidine kinase [Acidimicrobiales bacterium]
MTATTTARAPAPFPRPHARGMPGWLRDVAPAVVTGLLQVGVTRVAGEHQPDVAPLDALGVVLLLIGPAFLLVRRRRPAVALVGAFVPTMAYWLTDNPRGPVFLSLIVAYVTAVVRGVDRRLRWGALVAGWTITAWIAPYVHDEPWPAWSAVAGIGAWLLVLAAGTELIRSRSERAAQAAAARAEEARRLASEERLRIAQELHDVLAHNISLISVQSGVALHLLDEHPEQARPALAAINEASRAALGELRSVLDVLRAGASAPLQPTAGLAQLDALVERSRATGLEVVVECDGLDGVTLPGAVDLAAFRVVQEALTNVVRHAAARRATVRVTRHPGELAVQVDDDGRGAEHPPGAPAPGRPGRGLVGMRERAAALGGEVEAGPRPGRGYRVRARFPLGDPA